MNELERILSPLKGMEHSPACVREDKRKEVFSLVKELVERRPLLLGERMPRALFESQFRAIFGMTWTKACDAYDHEEEPLNVENGIIIAKEV